MQSIHGGPLICLNEKGAPVLSGIASRNSKSIKNGSPGIFTNIYVLRRVLEANFTKVENLNLRLDRWVHFKYLNLTENKSKLQCINGVNGLNALLNVFEPELEYVLTDSTVKVVGDKNEIAQLNASQLVLYVGKKKLI